MIYKLYKLYSRLTVCCSEIQKHEEREGKGGEGKSEDSSYASKENMK